MWKKARRHIDWFLTTDFDLHPPVSVDTVRCVLIVLFIIFILGGLTQ